VQQRNECVARGIWHIRKKREKKTPIDARVKKSGAGKRSRVESSNRGGVAAHASLEKKKLILKEKETTHQQDRLLNDTEEGGNLARHKMDDGSY